MFKKTWFVQNNAQSKKKPLKNGAKMTLGDKLTPCKSDTPCEKDPPCK